MFIDISKIDDSSRTQLRCCISEDTINLYAEDLRNGIKYPPVVLFPEGDKYFIGDGYHRIEAAKAANHKVIEAKIRRGGLVAALEYAAGANDKHGLRRTREDKQNAIRVLLTNPDFNIKSDRELGRIVHVDHHTVGSLREKLETSGEIPQIKEREVVRNGQTYTMDVEKNDTIEVVDLGVNGDGDKTVTSTEDVPLYNLIFAEKETLQKSKNTFSKISKKIIEGGFLLIATDQSEVPDIIKMVDKSLKFAWILSLPISRTVDMEKLKITSQWKPILVWYKGDPGSRHFGDFIYSNGDRVQLDQKKFYQKLLADFTLESDRLGVIAPEDHPVFKFGEDYKCRVESIEIKESKTIKNE